MTSAVAGDLRNTKGNTSALPETNLALRLATESAFRCPVSARGRAGAGFLVGGRHAGVLALHGPLPPQKVSWKESLQTRRYSLTRYSEHWRMGEARAVEDEHPLSQKASPSFQGTPCISSLLPRPFPLLFSLPSSGCQLHSSVSLQNLPCGPRKTWTPSWFKRVPP